MSENIPPKNSTSQTAVPSTPITPTISPSQAITPLTTTSNTNSQSTFFGFRIPSYIREIIKLNENTVGVALLCYLVGFIVTNIYLGSLGVVNLDILRVRYILSGLLFMSFVGIIFLSLRGLLFVIRYDLNKALSRNIADIIIFTFTTFSAMQYITMQVVRIFSGSGARPLINIPEITRPSFFTWIYSRFTPYIDKVLILPWLGAMICLVLICIYYFIDIINDFKISNIGNNKVSRLFHSLFQKETLRRIVKNRTRIIYVTTAPIMCVIMIYILISLTNFLTGNYGDKNTFSESIYGWNRFIGAAFLLYMIFGSYIFFISVLLRRRLSSGKQEEAETSGIHSLNPISQYLDNTRLAIICISFVIPIYTVGVYPTLPQQLGGGSPIPITAIASDDEVKKTFSNPDMTLYLIDRTSSSSLILIVDKKQKNTRVIEVPNSDIKAIMYKIIP